MKIVSKTSISIVVVLSVLAIIAVAAIIDSMASTSPNVASPSRCTAPCAVWIRTGGGNNPQTLAVSPDDSYLVVGNNSGIFVLDDHGKTLWSRNVNYTIGSLSISSNAEYIAAGAWQVSLGPAHSYTNGSIYLFNNTGTLLWSKNVGSYNPVWKVILSGNGSKLAVDTEKSIMYLEGANGSTVWSYPVSEGVLAAMDMSADGSLVVAGTGPIMAFDDRGTILWSHPAIGGSGSADSVAVSGDGSHIWDGSNNSLYFSTAPVRFCGNVQHTA